ncbi:unnamed protein product [Rhodiola kirilowii]
MADDVEQEVERITRRFRGQAIFTVSDDQQRRATESFEGALVLKLCTGERLKLGFTASMMRRAWKANDDQVHFDELGSSAVIATFRDEQVKQRALAGGPWSMNTMAMLVNCWQAGKLPLEYTNRTLKIWVQVFNLPSGYQNKEVGAEAALQIGEVVQKAEKKQTDVINGLKMTYVRERVVISVDQPLLKGTYMDRGALDPLWIAFRYEKLPAFCSNCGRLAHVVNNCPEPVPADGRINFGRAIRADSGFLEAEPEEVPPLEEVPVPEPMVVVPALINHPTPVEMTAPVLSHDLPQHEVADVTHTCTSAPTIEIPDHSDSHDMLTRTDTLPEGMITLVDEHRHRGRERQRKGKKILKICNSGTCYSKSSFRRSMLLDNDEEQLDDSLLDSQQKSPLADPSPMGAPDPFQIMHVISSDMNKPNIINTGHAPTEKLGPRMYNWKKRAREAHVTRTRHPSVQAQADPEPPQITPSPQLTTPYSNEDSATATGTAEAELQPRRQP